MSENFKTITRISAQQAKELLGKEKKVFLVDVRTPQEYDPAHIEDAISLPLNTISDTPPDQLPDLDATIVVYCHSGVRSAAAAGKLAALGYTHLYDMGGIIDWNDGTVSS